MKKELQNKIIIYEGDDGESRVEVRFEDETVWLTIDQMADLFNKSRSTINEHILNVYTEKELIEADSMKKIGNSDFSTKPTNYYNLDVIISVGYRVKSIKGTKFRQWATKTLRSYIVDGFVVNKNRIAKNYTAFLNVINDIKKLLPAESSMNPQDAIELVSIFADTWLSLDAYDRDGLLKGKLTKKKVALTSEKIINSLTELKSVLIRKSEATEIFGQERVVGSVAGIVGNVMQSFGGKELYQSVGEKAAHLLYFVVKNHPFVDGNKRSGAFVFVWFLKQAKILDVSKITPSALTAITILVASSNPKEKEKVIALILNLISKK